MPPPSPYVYRSAWKRAAAAALDRAGDALIARRPLAADWGGMGRVAVLRLDHLGDLLHALPALRRLRRALPKASLDLWVGPWGRELAALFSDIDAVRETPASWFERPSRQAWPWADVLSLAAGLRQGRYGAAFDLRGDLRHHLALWMAGIPLRAGQALSAGRFLLSHPARWVPGLHEQEQNLSLLDQAGVPASGQGSAGYLKLPPSAIREADALCRALRLGPAPVLVQAASGTQAKRWPKESWAKLLAGIPKARPLALLGMQSEAAEMNAIAALAGRPVAVAAGRLSLASLAALLARARLLISVDSGPAHLAAVQGTPVLALFSGTNEASQWAPRGAKVRVLRARGIPCAPCELVSCPFDNACMRALDPRQVLGEALRMLEAGRSR